MQERQADTRDGRPESGTGWQCPSCARWVPRNVEQCRCGSERRRLEALGYKIVTSAPQATARPAPRARQVVEHHGLASTLVGYRLDTDLAAPLRVVLKVLFALAVIGSGVALVRFTHRDPLPVRDNIEILGTLDGFTRTADPQSGNTIPMFLASSGRLGALATSGTPDDLVRTLREADVQQGFCTQSVAKQVRYEYPGYYEQWPDDKLERVVLEKYPEYADRVCVLSVRLDASATEVIKYEMKPRSLAGHAALWLRTLLITGLVAAICLNVYYRLIIGRLVSGLTA